MLRWRKGNAEKSVRPPDPHLSGARPPAIPANLLPKHVAIVMDGNGRWAKQRGLARTEGHRRGEDAGWDVIQGAIELGIPWLSLYTFSTENWKRSPDELHFLMTQLVRTIRARIDEFDELGVRVRWAGRRPRLWRSVINELEVAQERTKENRTLNLVMCINYGGRAEIADATREIARLVASGKINPERIDEKAFARYLYQSDMPDVDLFIRPSGELRTSNFLPWQSAYAEFVFQDILWPDYDRRHLWQACEDFCRRDRRYGGALPNPVAPNSGTTNQIELASGGPR